jgi:release factor glutamine methyltransferase
MPTIKEIREHQEAFLVKAKARKEPLIFTIEDVDVTVNPGVFPPATDTKLLASSIHVGKGERIIDVTTGSGVIPIIAALQGATGYAIDINSEAVKNAKQNVAKHKVDVKVLESNLFSNVPNEKFDVIFANGPFFEGVVKDPMDYACYGARAFIENLFKESATHLKRTGKLFIVVSEWSELDHLEKVAKENGLSATVIDKRKSDDGERGYLLYELRLM